MNLQYDIIFCLKTTELVCVPAPSYLRRLSIASTCGRGDLSGCGISLFCPSMALVLLRYYLISVVDHTSAAYFYSCALPITHTNYFRSNSTVTVTVKLSKNKLHICGCHANFVAKHFHVIVIVHC